MRTWAFDRLGEVASKRFDIDKDGLSFVTTILGFLWMGEEECDLTPRPYYKRRPAIHRDRAERSD